MAYEESFGNRALGYLVGALSLGLSMVFLCYLLWGK
jgi:hypothetical protein